ncbi:OmpA family protein [Litoreibacter albidus]|uniref:OmpA family protein n=1 Tax=Litoreibacter albidus TaxID=670155 RepID=A0A1H3A496_9RHOB|nr:OmpA family protein [Litoreibacter albidus]
MHNTLTSTLRTAIKGCAVLVSALTLSTTAASAQQQYVYTEDGFSQGTVANGKIVRRTTVRAERYIPTVWVDPDGCEHWVMDDGFEGFMTPHVTREGIPVCRRGNTCAVMNSDQLFATNQATINAANKRRLQQFFQSAGAAAYIIDGHTDSRASDAYNMSLSKRRANAVAQVARSVGARVSATRGYGERVPKASNRTSSGMAANRRVEIQCIR